jgi:hypothetical protein
MSSRPTSGGIQVRDNPCLCGSVPTPWIDPWLQPLWSNGTGLYVPCPGTCAVAQVPPPLPRHPDWPGVV